MKSKITPTKINDNDLDPSRIPVHIAIIMDGNGRWARRRGLPRVAGHRAGVKTVDRIVEEAVRLGVKVLTLYTFSSENWTRPLLEIKALMELLHANLISQRDRLIKNGVSLRISGHLRNFPEMVQRELTETIRVTASCQKLILNLALGYSGRGEIIDACRRLSAEVRDGKLDPEDIDEQHFANHLTTVGLPDPELLIRTSGECRLSNFLLWQCSYSEFYFTPVLWPDFDAQELMHAIFDYQKRERRFGGVDQEAISK
jgi:undecaprenyl diphosphate synthase